ncbi:MAG TPA: pirin family protein [Hyphomicrobiaceae bacterium]|nr:pirin family protein [Hyphomicrobiaceae bacterium]
MLTIRKAADRGHANHGWLDSFHTFSFAEYYDPRHMGFGPLRVINDDTVQGGHGFPPHPHRDMEIMSYVLEGALEHKDSTGTGAVIRPGDVQLMSAGTGVRHSEFNPSPKEPVHFLQIWIEPKFTGTKPRYQQKFFDESERRGRLRLIASPDGAEGALTIGQDTRVYAALMEGAERLGYRLVEGRRAYVHVARGEVTLNGQHLSGGDGVGIEGTTELSFADGKDAEILLFDLP